MLARGGRPGVRAVGELIGERSVAGRREEPARREELRHLLDVALLAPGRIRHRQPLERPEHLVELRARSRARVLAHIVLEADHLRDRGHPGLGVDRLDQGRELDQPGGPVPVFLVHQGRGVGPDVLVVHDQPRQAGRLHPARQDRVQPPRREHAQPFRERQRPRAGLEHDATDEPAGELVSQIRQAPEARRDDRGCRLDLDPDDRTVRSLEGDVHLAAGSVSIGSPAWLGPITATARESARAFNRRGVMARGTGSAAPGKLRRSWSVGIGRSGLRGSADRDFKARQIGGL